MVEKQRLERAAEIALVAISGVCGCAQMQYVNEPRHQPVEEWSEPSAPATENDWEQHSPADDTHAAQPSAPARRTQITPASAPTDALGLPPQPPRPDDTATTDAGARDAPE